MQEFKFYNYMPDEAKKIRTTVFVGEQSFVKPFDDADKNDAALHLVLYVDGKPAATARLVKTDNPKEYLVGKIAVLNEFRGFHLGSAVVEAMCEKAKEFGADKCLVNAQCRVKGFYNSLGFESFGDEYTDENRPHIHMVKQL